MFGKSQVAVGLFAFLIMTAALTTSCRQSEEKPADIKSPSTNPISTDVSSPAGLTNFTLRSVGSLQFAIPAGWTATMQVTESNRVPGLSLLFTPATGNDFVVSFAAVLGGNNLRTLDTKALLEKVLQQTTNALERKIEIQELKGMEISGHYFSITDRNLVNRMPYRGDYKYLVEGRAKMTRFATSFKILSNNPNGEDRKAALEMIRTVRFVAS